MCRIVKFRLRNKGFLVLGYAASVRKEIQDETDRLTGKTKHISNIPIHLSIYSPNGLHFNLPPTTVVESNMLRLSTTNRTNIQLFSLIYFILFLYWFFLLALCLL